MSIKRYPTSFQDAHYQRPTERPVPQCIPFPVAYGFAQRTPMQHRLLRVLTWTCLVAVCLAVYGALYYLVGRY